MTDIREVEIFEQGIEALKSYGPGATLRDVILINIRKGEYWAADCWVHSRKSRGPFSNYCTSHRIWCELVSMAAKLSGDWIVDETKSFLDGVKPRKKAKIRKREELVIWLVLEHTDIAFAIDDDA